METALTAPFIPSVLCSFFQRLVLMSCVMAVAGKECPGALVSRSSRHHLAFIVSTLQQCPPTTVWGGRRPQLVPPTRHRSNTGAAGSTACSSLALAASPLPCPSTWCSSGRGLGRRRHRCWPSPSLSKVVSAFHYRNDCLSGGLTGPSSSSSGGGSGGGIGGDNGFHREQKATRTSFAAAVDVRSGDNPRRTKPCEGFVGSQDGSDRGDPNHSRPAVLEVEPLVERVASALEQHCGVKDGDLVLVLVSGGCDSVALLLALHQVSRTFQPALRVEAAHFNHALRGKDSDTDQEFVVKMANSLGVPLHVRRWKGGDEGGTGGPGAGIQERARIWRRSEAKAILSKIMSKAGSEGRGRGVIATAHHKDDQTETVLLKALRGAHITNMQGMAWHGASFVRPLLGARKSDLMDFLVRRGQSWREDMSNQVTKYARNRVRLRLIPLLQELAGGAKAFETRVEELARQSLFARQMLEREALRWEREHLDGRQCAPEIAREGTKVPPGVRREEFPLPAFLRKGAGVAGGEASEQGRAGCDLPELVREELLHRFVMENTDNAPLPYAHLQLLMRQVDGGERKWSLALGGGYFVRRVGDFLRVQHSPAYNGRTASDLGGLALGTIGERGAAQPPTSWKMVIEPCRKDDSVWLREKGAETKDHGHEKEMGEERSMVLFNVAAGTQLHVRRKKDGDRFWPTWRDRPTKLKDFLRGQGVPLHRRDEVALICDQDDSVIAVYPSYPGFGFCEDDTGEEAVRVRIEGAPLFCPGPGDRGGPAKFRTVKPP